MNACLCFLFAEKFGSFTQGCMEVIQNANTEDRLRREAQRKKNAGEIILSPTESGQCLCGATPMARMMLTSTI
jgi:hypothetical protein